MKTILVDAVDAFVVETENGFEIFEPMRKMLDEFPNRKIILTGTNDEQFRKFGLDKIPEDVICFAHNPEVVKSAESVGIKTHFLDNEKRPMRELQIFLDIFLFPFFSFSRRYVII